MRLLKISIAFGFGVTILGCATPPEAQDLVKVTKNTDVIFIPQKITYQTKPNLGGYSWYHSLLAGKYKADVENSYGTYYVGQGKLVHLQPVNVPEVPSITRVGGIWVPSDKQQQPRMYSITGSENTPQYNSLPPGRGSANIVGAAIGNTIVDALIQFEQGQVYFFEALLHNSTL